MNITEDFVKINLDYIQPYYMCDIYGNIYSDYYGDMRKLAFDEDKDGYYRVSLQRIDGVRSSFRVNRLIAITFIPNPNNLPIVNHKDNDKKNNCVDNLEWTTISENTKHGYQCRNYHYVKPIIVTDTEGKIKHFNSIKECAEYYNVKQSTISDKLTRSKHINKNGKLKGLKFEYKIKES